MDQKGVRSLDGESGRNKSPEAGFSGLCARNLAPDLFGWNRSAG